MSYAFNGQYRPVLCKYISHLLFPEDNRTVSLEDVSRLLPGDYQFITRGGHSVRSNQQNFEQIIFILYIFI